MVYRLTFLGGMERRRGIGGSKNRLLQAGDVRKRVHKKEKIEHPEGKK